MRGNIKGRRGNTNPCYADSSVIARITNRPAMRGNIKGRR